MTAFQAENLNNISPPYPGRGPPKAEAAGPNPVGRIERLAAAYFVGFHSRASRRASAI
jgi:hypothetical protein